MVIIPTLAFPADVDMRAGGIGQVDIKQGLTLALRAQRGDDQGQRLDRDGCGRLDEGKIRPRWGSGMMLRPGRGVPGPEWQRQGRQRG